MTVDFTQLIAQLPIAGAMIYFAIKITNDSKEERNSWADERKEMYAKMSESHLKLRDSIEKTHTYIGKNTETLQQLITKKCYKDDKEG